jgi:hypothetical protein
MTAKTFLFSKNSCIHYIIDININNKSFECIFYLNKKKIPKKNFQNTTDLTYNLSKISCFEKIIETIIEIIKR